ncbi:serine hydrolase domain-containing protein [Bacillus sp. REN16]|uniref:serine hydrolase domain-containing protein n=1 Tax=Bacillus sp. REN16 TaxID=2887296 RepID=UPI001E39E4C0|nr:serine hydrolase domain-containing protein [Bacillus sp. REN16]MCC3356781.1 beta-lactamase family protein [Bacillus sp. REN16]
MKNIIQLMDLARRDKTFSGAVFAYGNSREIVAQGSVGTLAWGAQQVGIDSMWDLASVTKPLVSLALMKLFEQGELSLDDPISYFLPSYQGTDKAKITLFELLTHTSGIPGQQPLYKHAKTAKDMKVAVRQLPLRHKPGTYVEYTSQGFMIIGDIIEQVVDMRLDKGMHELVFGPLGIMNILFNPPPTLHNRIAATENCPWRNKVVKGQVHDENCVVLEGVAGHAGLFGTAIDLSTICQMMLRKGATDHVDFLKGPTVQLMTRNYTSSLNLSRALGWQAKDQLSSPAGDLFSPYSYGHTGFTGTSIWMDPEQDLFAVLLTNRVHPSRESDSIQRIRRIFHNLVVLNMDK